MVMWRLMRVSTMVVVVMVCRMGDQTRMRQRIRGKANGIERIGLLGVGVLMLRMVMMVMMAMMVVVMSSFRSFVPSL